MKNRITEIVTMKSSEGVGKEEFIEILDELERGFHMRQSGYIDTELLYDDNDNTWIMIQHWESLEQTKAASKEMFRDSATERYRAAIDPKQIKISAYPALGIWCSDNDVFTHDARNIF